MGLFEGRERRAWRAALEAAGQAGAAGDAVAAERSLREALALRSAVPESWLDDFRHEAAALEARFGYGSRARAIAACRLELSLDPVVAMTWRSSLDAASSRAQAIQRDPSGVDLKSVLGHLGAALSLGDSVPHELRSVDISPVWTEFLRAAALVADRRSVEDATEVLKEALDIAGSLPLECSAQLSETALSLARRTPHGSVNTSLNRIAREAKVTSARLEAGEPSADPTLADPALPPASPGSNSGKSRAQQIDPAAAPHHSGTDGEAQRGGVVELASQATATTMNDEERAVLYEAGFLAGSLGWPNPSVISVAEISEMQPIGDPVIVLCKRDGLAPDQARAIAALQGAGRDVRVITTAGLTPDAAAWLPIGSIHEVGVKAPAASPPMHPFEGSTSTVADSYSVDMDEWVSPGDGDADLLASTPIALNWSVAWWALDGRLYCPDDNSEWHFNRYDPIPALRALIALPFLVGEANVLGVSVPDGQFFPSADSIYVVSGNWQKAELGFGKEWVRYPPSPPGFSCSVVSALVNRLNPRDPDPLSVGDEGAQLLFENVIGGMLEGITRGYLRHGSHGFETMKPRLASWIDERRNDAVNILRGV